MKHNGTDRAVIVFGAVFLTILLVFFLSAYFDFLAGICVSSILFFVAGLYAWYRNPYSTKERIRHNAKNIAREFTKEELKEPIRLNDLRGWKAGMKLTIRHGPYVAALATVGVGTLLAVPLLFVLFYFIDGPDSYFWVFMLVIWMETAYFSAKTFNEAAAIIEAEGRNDE